MVKSDHPLAGKKVECSGTPPDCGHNHHTGYSHAWGLTWDASEIEEWLDSDEFEDHVSRLMEAPTVITGDTECITMEGYEDGQQGR